MDIFSVYLLKPVAANPSVYSLIPQPDIQQALRYLQINKRQQYNIVLQSQCWQYYYPKSIQTFSELLRPPWRFLSADK